MKASDRLGLYNLHNHPLTSCSKKMKHTDNKFTNNTCHWIRASHILLRMPCSFCCKAVQISKGKKKVIKNISWFNLIVLRTTRVTHLLPEISWWDDEKWWNIFIPPDFVAPGNKYWYLEGLPWRFLLKILHTTRFCYEPPGHFKSILWW